MFDLLTVDMICWSFRRVAAVTDVAALRGDGGTLTSGDAMTVGTAMISGVR